MSLKSLRCKQVPVENRITRSDQVNFRRELAGVVSNLRTSCGIEVASNQSCQLPVVNCLCRISLANFKWEAG